jgi:hypothetical protein
MDPACLLPPGRVAGDELTWPEPGARPERVGDLIECLV